MLKILSSFVTVLFVTIAGTAWSADDQDILFTGDETGLTGTFEIDGPWLLDWSIHGKSKLSCNFAIWANDDAKGQPCNFEMRLIDASTGDYLGTIAQLEGTGRGFKLFEQPGSYRIDIVSQNINWKLLIRPVDEQMAAELKARTETEAPLAARVMATSRRVAEGTFSSWRPVDDETLLLFAEDETRGHRVTFSPPCTGLSKATALSFVTVFDTGVESYNSILLDDGTQCYFNRVIPTVFD